MRPAVKEEEERNAYQPMTDVGRRLGSRLPEGAKILLSVYLVAHPRLKLDIHPPKRTHERKEETDEAMEDNRTTYRTTRA